MKRITMWLALAGLLVPTTTAEAQVRDPILKNVLAVIDGADRKILGPLGPGEGLSWGETVAGEILAQYTGSRHELGGRRSAEELDAFAEELIARAIANPDGRNIVLVFRIAGIVEPDDPHRIPYEKAFDALVRLYEAGVASPGHLFDVDGVRAVKYQLGRLQERNLNVGEACDLLYHAYEYGEITLRSDGSLSFQLGGVQASGHTSKTYDELQVGRFVVSGNYGHGGWCGGMGTYGRQERSRISDPVLKNVLAVLNGGGPKLLNPDWGEGTRVTSVFARNILSQYTGRDVRYRGGGRRSAGELDAFAEELIALAIANPPRDVSNDISSDIVDAFSGAGTVGLGDPHRVRYEGAFDALVRIHKAHALLTWDPLYLVDPVRAIEYLLGRLQEVRMDQATACRLLLDAYDHGKITLEDDGSLSFEPGGVQASGHAGKTFDELQLWRFVAVNGEKPPECRSVADSPGDDGYGPGP